MVPILCTALLLVLQEPSKIAPVQVGQSPNSTSFEGKVYFAGQPSQADLEEYAKLGVKKVINLRMPAEMEKVQFNEAEAAKAAGMEYVSVPFSTEPPSDSDFKKLFEALGGEQKVLLHCASSNRAGFVWAMYRGSEKGLGIEEAVAEGKAAGMKNPNLEKIVREKLKK